MATVMARAKAGQLREAVDVLARANEVAARLLEDQRTSPTKDSLTAYAAVLAIRKRANELTEAVERLLPAA